MLVASISVGIGQYLREEYSKSDMRLLYAQDDARAFSLYARGADDGGGPDERHRLLVDDQAEWQHIAEAAAEIVSRGRPDLFVLYLSGHGEAGLAPVGGWFCLFDARAGDPSLTGARIDELFRIVDAPNSMLIIDCCFAEAVVASSGFFRNLERASARFAVASARSNQRSWEDAGLKRSIFSDVLIRALSVGSAVADSMGYVDVEGALFPALRQQVPLLASTRKDGAVQEPVTFGVATQEIRLPTVFGRSLGRPLTVAEAVRSGVKRYLVGAMLVAVLILVGLDALVYHVAVAPTGAILVRPGLRQTFELQPLHPSTVDTGIRLDQVDRVNDDGARRLAEAKIVGFRTHTDENGLRTWLSSLEPMLNAADQKSTLVFSRGAKPSFDPDKEAPPLLEATFLALLGNSDVRVIGQQIYPLKLRVDVPCDATGIVDFTLTSPPPDAFDAQVSWAAATAPKDSINRATRLMELMRLAAYRAIDTKDPDVLRREFDTFAMATLRIVAGTDDRQALATTSRQLLPKGTDGWCAVHARFLIAAIGSAEESRVAEKGLWDVLFTYDPNKELPRHIFAAEALRFLARVRELDQDAVARLANWIDSSSEGLDVDHLPQILLREIGAIRGYSEPIQAWLETKIGQKKTDSDFDELVAVRLLACSVLLDSNRRERLKQWLQSNTANQRTMSDFATALGCASRYQSLENAQLQVLFDRLSPLSRFAPPSVNYWGETIITANGDAAAVALGRYAQDHELPADRIEQLANIAQSRTDLVDRIQILRGLAARWYASRQPSADDINRRLRASINDGARRSLEVEVAADLVSRAANRAMITTDFLQLWRAESEPEMRIAIAKTLAKGAAP
ncbi:hypothetical protein Q3C01_08590 [Bradyrhizobium sp. UFLA05-109]